MEAMSGAIGVHGQPGMVYVSHARQEFNHILGLFPGVYYCFNLVLIVFAVILSSLVVNVSRGFSFRTQAPRWVYFVSTFFHFFNILQNLCDMSDKTVNR